MTTDTTQDPPTSETETRPSDPQPNFRATVDRLLKIRQVDDAGIEAERKAEMFQRRFEVLQQDGVPSRIRKQLHGLERTKPLLRVDQFIQAENQWCLVLCSPPGTGKSTAAAYWLWNISPDRTAAAGPSFRRWWTACELATADIYGGELAKLKAPGPLVIDDLGTEYLDKHGHFARIVDDLFDGRYREELPTLITTNLNRKAFVKRYGERIADRIREGGAFFEFNTKSLRGQS